MSSSGAAWALPANDTAAMQAAITVTMRPFIASPVLPRRPEHVAGAFVIGVTAGDEQEIGKPVDILQRRPADRFSGPIIKFDHHALRTTADRAREMQIGRGRASARQNERPQWLQIGIEPVDFLLDPFDLRIG